MKLVQIDEGSIVSAGHFIAPYEISCVSLADVLLHLEPSIKVYALVNESGIRGIFSYSKSGVVLHCFPYIDELQHESEVIRQFFGGRYLFCINGEAAGTGFLENIVCTAGCGRPLQENHYILMVRRQLIPLPEPAYSAVRCTESDIDSLLPLETAYQLEEVIPPGEKLNLSACRAHLLHTLKMHTVFAISHPSTGFLAKAGTNAEGKSCAQIGGVYTIPSERCRGYASAAIVSVLRFLAGQNKDSVLFVKETNTAALALYRSTGFSDYTRYSIAYY